MRVCDAQKNVFTFYSHFFSIDCVWEKYLNDTYLANTLCGHYAKIASRPSLGALCFFQYSYSLETWFVT